MKAIFEYPFAKIKYRGQPLFPKGRLYEGNDKASVMFADLEELYGKNV